MVGDDVLRDTRRPPVSEWSVGEHVEHLMLADRKVVGWIGRVAGDPRAPGEGAPRPIGWLVLLTGFIPRGRGRAPDGTTPGGRDPLALRDGLGDLRRELDALIARLDQVRASRATLPHPVLGAFTPTQWLRFLDVHHRHHQKVIADIRAPH